MSNGLSHCRLEWDIPECRRWYEALAGRHRLVRFDFRGVGLSDRDVADYSPDALVLDLEAVVDRLELERFALWGQLTGGVLATAYAVRHPERVTHLILWCSTPQVSEVLAGPHAQALRTLINSDWKGFTETFARMGLGWTDDETGTSPTSYHK